MAKSNMTITIDFNYIPAVIASVEARSRSAPKKVADRIAATARQLVPKDTWQLHDSIQAISIRTGKEAEVVALTDYAAFVEYGTYRMAAQPYIGPAVEQHAEELGAEIMGSLEAW